MCLLTGQADNVAARPELRSGAADVNDDVAAAGVRLTQEDVSGNAVARDHSGEYESR
jgi:hypothetical protein